MIRIRGLPVSTEDAARLAQGLRTHSGASIELAERLDRAVIAGVGMIAADKTQSRALLAVLEEQPDDEGLQGIRESLWRFGAGPGS